MQRNADTEVLATSIPLHTLANLAFHHPKLHKKAPRNNIPPREQGPIAIPLRTELFAPHHLDPRVHGVTHPPGAVYYTAPTASFQIHQCHHLPRTYIPIPYQMRNGSVLNTCACLNAA